MNLGCNQSILAYSFNNLEDMRLGSVQGTRLCTIPSFFLVRSGNVTQSNCPLQVSHPWCDTARKLRGHEARRSNIRIVMTQDENPKIATKPPFLLGWLRLLTCCHMMQLRATAHSSSEWPKVPSPHRRKHSSSAELV